MTLAFPNFRLLDLSVALSNNPNTDPPGLGPQIEYADHKQGLAEMLRMFPGLKADDLPDGEAWGVERLRITAHNGTHIDAPWHGGFKWSSQHLDWSCDEHSKTALASFWAGALVLARSTAGGRARGAAAILGSDCSRQGE